jgi:hypothetical protein
MTSVMPGLFMDRPVCWDALRPKDHLGASCGEQPGIMGLRIAVIMRAKQHGLGLVCGLGSLRWVV